jgi:BirA family biotin operon repressor/biotin-[acetyl-CoA-carboxylase] ligase
MTLVLRPPFIFNPLDTLPLLGALAVARTVNSSLGIKANVRWPNDIVVGRQKLAGVLAETTFIGNQSKYTLLGIGINANFHPNEMKEISPTPTTLLEILGSPIDREELICMLLLETEHMYELASSKRGEDLMNLLRELDCSRKKHVKIGIGTEEISGVLEDYDTFTKIRIRTTQGSRVNLETSSVASVEYIDF